MAQLTGHRTDNDPHGGLLYALDLPSHL